ncbi:hypothetical protein GCM10023169_27260 [Georgenia halophila]|uniref:Uncharacterized protein n=1 Tax=Georgenia halophila TaxID=620889 RepID=A0ABP8LFA8_9MICO
MSGSYGVFSVAAGLDGAIGTLEEVRAELARSMPTSGWTGPGSQSYADAVSLLLGRTQTVNASMYSVLPALHTADAVASAQIAGGAG